jgi:hypothetical protein
MEAVDENVGAVQAHDVPCGKARRIIDGFYRGARTTSSKARAGRRPGRRAQSRMRFGSLVRSVERGSGTPLAICVRHVSRIQAIPCQRIAPLRAPLRGWALFGAGKKRLSEITIEGGRAETARHGSIGSTASEARAAYPSSARLIEDPVMSISAVCTARRS